MTAGAAPDAGRTALSLHGLTKRYGDLLAVDRLTLDVPEGICLGLLGPNGAGKSTTMKMLTGQVRADEGTILVKGLSVPQQSKQARAVMGVVPQLDNMDEELTCGENLLVWTALEGVPRRQRRDAVARALDMVGLADRVDARVATLSGGMRRRLLIARGLVHDPHLVLLDEPTVGLDPQVRAEIWSIVDRLRSDGATILMSTHYIEEAERLADDVVIMDRGRIIARGAPRDLIAEHAGSSAIEFYGPPQHLRELTDAIGDHPMRRTGPSVSLLRAEEAPRVLLDMLGPGSSRQSTLEDVFVLLTGEDPE
ncbi:MAG: ABC transporter ATP-binding protein [Actinomycetota bacterium]